MNNYKEGFAAEMAAISNLESMGLTFTRLPVKTGDLVLICKSLVPVFWERAVPYFNSPPNKSKIQDTVLGIDAVFNYRGWIVAFDFTLRRNEVDKKVSDGIRRKKAYEALNIDRYVVCHIIGQCARADEEAFRAELSRVIKTDQVVQTVTLIFNQD